ncbi:DNA repair ATPase [uncultured Microscilla sp.]|uniref:DNA repair ATPase n=1 Tax=uncultured Microscilla sp. TaxID=432653 RepID=UPI0026042E15|nr:DNA repair ATPase [uncultured Microscilla sp.]
MADAAENLTNDNPEENKQETKLEGGAYEIIRQRLDNQGRDLQDRLHKLNEARKEVFGAIEQDLIATNRITTENNCIPRDVVPIGAYFIFGYNVSIRMKSKTELKDVFSIYRYDNKNHSFHAEPLDKLFSDNHFQERFDEMYKYYRDTVFMRFTIIQGKLFMVFQTGKSSKDIKVFKWIINEDSIAYVDDRSAHEFTYPSQQQFDWKRTRADYHRTGQHPHVSIEDRVFVETIGGDLTIKVEDNTETGEGIYAEEVEHKDQNLDDAEILYTDLGNLILLKIRPYLENEYRYLVFNEKLNQVVRIDKIEEACILLPDSQGLIFSNGYYLQSGELKVFENVSENLLYEKTILAPNGEDFLYVFHNDQEGSYVLLSYNIIAQKVDNPIVCDGYSLFEEGEMIYFRETSEPSKSHVIQVWQTPYVGPDYIPPVSTENFLFKVGNKDIVRAMAEVTQVLNLIHKEDIYTTLYMELVKRTTDILDTYYWLSNPEAFEMQEPVSAIRDTASGAIDEFEKVQRVKKNTEEQINLISGKIEEVKDKVKQARFRDIDEFVKLLAELRSLRGETISLKDLRYTNLPLVEEFEQLLEERTLHVSEKTVKHLLKETALDFYKKKVEEQSEAIEKVAKVMEITQIEQNIDEAGKELEMLIDIVSNLKIEDSTQTTKIIDNISTIYARLNQVKSAAKTKRKDLMSVEAIAEFNAQIKLINQGVINYLDIADTPEKAEEYLTKLMVQLEELEGKFVEFDEFIAQLTEKREEVYSAFEAKKLSLIEARNKRATALQSSADRILKGIQNRIKGFETVNEINGYFAADLMIDKTRDIVKKLVELEDSVKADEIQSRLKTIKEDAVRQLKDRQEMFVSGENVIKFGRHHFSVNVQNLDLTIIQKADGMYYHLTGTNFFEKIDNKAFLATEEAWSQELVSENQRVYRAEYLAYKIYQEASDASSSNEVQTGEANEGEKVVVPAIADLHQLEEAGLLELVQKFMASRYSEGYVKGTHDQDAAKILGALVKLNQNIQLLRYPTIARACAAYYWQKYLDRDQKQLLNHRLKGIGVILQVFPNTREFGDLIHDISGGIRQFLEETSLFDIEIADLAGEYLFYELTVSDAFIISKEAAQIHDGFLEQLRSNKNLSIYKDSLKQLSKVPLEQFELIRTWVHAFVHQSKLNKEVEFIDEYIDETASLLFHESYDQALVIETSVVTNVDGMLGNHRVIENKTYHLNYNDFMLKLNYFEQHNVPFYLEYIRLKKELTDNFRKTLRLNEFKPRVLSSFVRSKLIDEVYLPLVGDNLAKQIGVVGENKRTDLMGMLLLISPPGYGKTTLMEYIANRLGVIFMKINGPAIGHQVTSLDPAEANNASAREEVNKLNLAFEMGDNVMIYLDDIQHCNPEFLQKFISLCDGQRKIEGVYKGKTKTYDMRGRKVCVVMAGNPYTESGDKFQIPDMLANRADTYNLGDIIGGTATAFEMSYIENSLTSSPILNKLATRSQKDIYALIRVAETDNQEGMDLEGNYSSDEVAEYINVLKKLLIVRDYVLKNNLEYIRSAAQADEFRTEPPFKLQGSYRNMNKIAEKIQPIMTNEELQTLIMSHYENEAQTLTSGAESNLLKFKELNGLLSEEEAARWEDIKETFRKNMKMSGFGANDQMGQVLMQMGEFNDNLDGIRNALEKSIKLDSLQMNRLLSEQKEKAEKAEKAIKRKDKNK